MKNWRSYFDARTDDMVAELRRLVEIESPSRDKAAVDALGAVIAQETRALGATVTVDQQSTQGNHIIARWDGPADKKQLLILCHMDTVWPLGTLAERPVRIESDRFYGAGSYDMKGGIVIALTALRGLRDLGVERPRPVTALFTSDEEIGSRTSRALIESEARKSELVLVLEPATAQGTLKTSRKGTGAFVVTTRGVAAHAGAAHDEGVNAIEELAHQILAIQAMTDYAKGTTVNVGRVEGGQRTNVVPDKARAWVDLRVSVPEEGQRMLKALTGLKPKLPGATVEVKGELSRPPMPRDETMVQTYQRAAAIAGEIGVEVSEGATGGASDGNFSAALGIPTLDGLGAKGDGGHALHEHVLISSLPERAALLAALLARW